MEGHDIWLLIKLYEQEISAGRYYRGLCTHDLVGSQGGVRKACLLRSDITVGELRERNVLITLGTGVAPFIWILDLLKHKNGQCLFLYTNSYGNEIFHEMLCEKW